MQINFSGHESYHTVPLSTFTRDGAEQLLSDDRKKFLRSIAKDKSGQGAGPGALSAATKNVYSKLVKQAAIKQKWQEYKQMNADSDTDPLTDVEYDNEPAESDAAGGTPGSSLAAAGASSQKHAQESTPPPSKKQKQQKLKLPDWMLLMCKLTEMQMSEKMKAVAEEAGPLKEQLQTLVAENKQQQETIEQQKSVISGINALLKESAK